MDYDWNETKNNSEYNLMYIDWISSPHLIHSGLVMIYGVKNLDHHWFR